MAETKYGKYVMTNPKRVQTKTLAHHKDIPDSGVHLEYISEDTCPGVPCRVTVSWEHDPPEESLIVPHQHDVDEILLFIAMGRDEDLGVDVSIALGEEGEVHTFNRTTLVYIPAGLKHGPLLQKHPDKSKCHCTVVCLLRPNYA